MFAAASDQGSRNRGSQTCGKDMNRSGHKVNRKTSSADVTLPPLCPKPPRLSSALVTSPLFKRTSVLQDVLPDRPSPVVELPQLVPQVGRGRAVVETKCKEGPGRMASATGTDIPIRLAELPAKSLTEKDELIKVTACKNKKTAMATATKGGKATKPNKCPLTGLEVVRFFAEGRHQEDLEIYYLREVDGNAYRPYDLQVVDSSEAGSEHYTFSPGSVLHVTERGYGGLVSLAEWHRESLLWRALQKIPFFRDFRLLKTLTWWRRNVRRIFFQRRSLALQDMLLITVPQFRSALHVFARLTEDLKETHWLPLDDCQTYTLLEFKNVLKAKSQECLHILKKLSRYRTVILNSVKEKSCKEYQELQLHMEYAKKPNRTSEPIHLHLAHQQELKNELASSENVLHKLGNFGSLMNRMIVQSLVTLISQDVFSFLSSVMKRKKSEQCSLFYSELRLSASSQLTVDPPLQLFQEAVSKALLTVSDSVIQMCESCGFFLEISNSVFLPTSDLSCIACPTVIVENKNNSGSSCCRKFCGWQLLSDPSAQQPENLIMMEGSRVHGCYTPLSRSQLEWHIRIGDLSKQAESDQLKIMKETELELQQLCEHNQWLVDIHLFVSQWSRTSLESMKGQPALYYEELVKKMRTWGGRISTVPSSISTSNQLFLIDCTYTKETLGRQLRLIEDEVLEHLVEQIKLQSENLISDMERAAAKVKTEPQDLHDLSKYALAVRESLNMLGDMQNRLAYVHSLQNTICLNYREMTEQELTLEEKMLSTWDCFAPVLKDADGVVCHRLPSGAKALDTMVSFLACDLKNVVSTSTSGSFLDPSQDAREMVSKLSNMCTHVHSLNAKLEQLNRNSQNLQESMVDLNFLTMDMQRITARKELWELIATYTTWMEEWKQLPFSEVVVSQTQENIAKWREQALSLTSTIPAHDAVLQEALGKLERLNRQLALMAKLQSPTLRHKHWRAIFKGLGMLYVPERKLTVAELISQPLEDHQKLIIKICSDAQAEYKMEQTFQKLQQGWEARLFRLDIFTLPVWQHCQLQHGLKETHKPSEGTDSNLQTTTQYSCNETRCTITGLEILFVEIENDLMVLSTMLKSPYSFEFRQQINNWVQSLQDLEKLLELFERHQEIWAFLTLMFNETFFSVQRVDLLKQFKPVDETFKEIMNTISADPHVLNLVNSKKTNEKFHGNSLCQILIVGLSTMETISNQMVDVLDALRDQFPRLRFLSDGEVIQLLSFHPVPFMLQLFVRKCFKGVLWLEVDSEIPCNASDVNTNAATSGSHGQMKVLGFFSRLQEHITFLSPLEPNINALVWLSTFEKHLKLTMVQLVRQCALVHNQLQCDRTFGHTLFHSGSNQINMEHLLDLLTEYPLQCLLVAEEAVWCSMVLEAFQKSSPLKLSNIKEYIAEKLKNLCHSIRNKVREVKSECLMSKYTAVCLRALVQLTMKHAQQLSQLMEVKCAPESSFEWLSLMKYYINSDPSQKGNDNPTCYLEVLGHRFQYGYEYFGPEHCFMVHTPSTHRATLGILLALTSYRCGFVSGPCMSGKKKTVVQLGKALGRQIVIVQCYPNIRPGVVQQMLFGALQTGAWLLLDSVDLLTHGVLSSLGQLLIDIHRSFCGLTGSSRTVNDEQPDMISNGVAGSTNIDPKCHVVLAGKRISSNLNYGCVLISSKWSTSEVPESLRFATRPVALTHPDYRIIAEVMLTSIGFSEAKSLSQRLVSLISLSKDSHSLPTFISEYQSSYLVVLQKIISASEIHLQQTAKQREISDEDKSSATEKNDPMCSQNLSATDAVKNSQESEKPSRSRKSCLSVKWGLMEETAIVKAILSVLMPFLYDHEKASQFYMVFKNAFPIVSQFPVFQQQIDKEEKKQLKEAIAEELQRKQFNPDTETISSTLSLYQTMKVSQAVLLIGPAGSGKTTCFSSLAGALNSLAAKEMECVFENDQTIGEDSQKADLQISSSNWKSVDTVVLFPNAMSHDEVLGCFCGKRGWQDGAITNLLRSLDRWERACSDWHDSKTKSVHTPIVKWLVMDGEPAGQPGWLDYLTTLCSFEDPFLFLPSGEELVPSQSHLKLLMEITDLSDATPSTVTRCGLIQFTGTNLWKAVWKKEIDALYCQHRLAQGTFKMWNRLAEDLFSSTLSLVKQRALTSAIHGKAQSSKSPTYGLQEIMSFVRILSALLHHFGKELEKAEAATQIGKEDIPLYGTGTPVCQSKQDLFARDLFLLAYVWGFGAHLDPGHWPQFDSLVRSMLFSCRYKIVVPDEENVFEHFFSTERKMFPQNSLLTNSITPKYGKYTFLLNLMLEASQPVLLAGEPCSGKTSLCQSLLCFDKPHISLPASPLLSSRDLRATLNNIICQKHSTEAAGSETKQRRLLLFVDDLHEAPCDAFGKTSTALESLRQSISKGGILTFDNYHFNFLNSGAISYMATCSVSGYYSNAMSSRLSRLFSIFVLPTPSTDILLSVHSPRLEVWLKGIPLHQSKELACCIITATEKLYHAVCNQFKPTAQRPHFLFSHHDLQKVFEGMYLWQPDVLNTGTMQSKTCKLFGFPEVLPEPTASVLNIAHLWVHECMRTFSDRLISPDESKTLVSLVAKVAATHYGIRLGGEPHPDSTDAPATVTTESPDRLSLPTDPKPLDQSDLERDCTMAENNFSEKETPRILQHMESIMTRLIYGPEFTLISMDQETSSKCSSGYMQQDLDALLQKLSALLDRNNNDKQHGTDKNYNITSRYIVHRHRVSQLLHIVRALLIPGGHGVLMSSDRGTGRRTTVRLAAHLTGFQLMEVHSGNESKLHEILKEAGNRTRVDGGNVVILVHEDISHSVREELLVAMAHRTYPAIYTEEELKNIVSRVTAVKNSKRYRMDSWMLDKFLRQVHRNIHVFLLMPFTMSGTSIEKNRQMMKALSLSCCVEVYQPWSRQSLVEVAAQHLKTSHHEMKRVGSVAGLSVAMAEIHHSACQYASVLLKVQPFSPQTYLDLIAHFGYLSNHLHKQWQGRTNRVTSVLSRLDVLNSAALQNKWLLDKLRAKIAERQQREKDLLGAVADQKHLLEDAQRKCMVEKNKLHDLEEQNNNAQKQVIPVFLSGLKILKCLNPSDLEEVRHYRDPPDGVVTVMDAICLLFNRPPGWENAKQLIGQSNFFQELEFFDRFNLTNEQLQQLGQIVNSPQFVPESVQEVSKACQSLCRWIQAVYEWCCVQHQLLVKQQLEELEKEARSRLYRAKQHVEDASHRLEELKLQLPVVQKDIEEQRLELQRAEKLERQATITAGQLEERVIEWKAAAQEAELHDQNLAGDALILAAVIAYSGPFTPECRAELLNKWRELFHRGSISVNPEDPRTSLFTQSDPAPSPPPLGFPIPVTERVQLPLSRALGLNEWQRQNVQCARLVVQLLLWGHRNALVQRWPLLADFQQHLERSSQSWLITGENVHLEWEMEICASDPALQDKLNQAAQTGLRVLVNHVEQAMPSFSQCLARLAPPAGCCLSGCKHHVQSTHPEFRLFLSTHLPVRLLSSEVHPSILAQLHVIDLSLSSDEIQELMLTQLLQSDRKELLVQHLRFQNDKHLLQEQLVTEEDALMDYILQSNTSLLEDCDHCHMAVFQEATEKLQAEIQLLNEELEYHETLVSTPRQLVKLAAALYQALQEVSRLSPAYCFSLRGFISATQDAFLVNGRPLVTYTTRGLTWGLGPEITNTMIAQLLVRYRPRLFKSHVSVLKLLASVALLQHNRLCSEGERAAFLRGLQGVEHPIKVTPCSPPQTASPSTTSLPSWIPPHIHPDLLCLDHIPAFTGLISSLSTSPSQWQEYLRFPSSTVIGTVPCRSHSHLSLLQRALLWKTMLPHCLEGVADAIAACTLCLPVQTVVSEAAHTGNPESLSLYIAEHQGPIILALPGPGGDNWTSIQPLQLIHKLAKTSGKQEVQLISFGAQCNRDILSALDAAISDGHWFVFNNCHLLEKWDHKVLARLSQLISSHREERGFIHPHFRLWFITQEYASHHIPAAVRMCALPLVCDSSCDMEEELSCSLQQVASIIKCRSLPGVKSEHVEFLLRCAIFHSVLLQRQTSKCLGQSRIYNWSQEDLLVLVDAYISIASLCHDQSKALQYIAVHLVHGGHVRDSADLEAVEGIAKTCLSGASPLRDSGPHILSDIINNPSRFDLSGLLQNVGLQDSENIDNPPVLGFSLNVATEINKINSHNLKSLLQASQNPLGTGRKIHHPQLKKPFIMPPYKQARDRLQALQSYLTDRATHAGAVAHSPLCDFLQAELDELIDMVSSLLSQLQQPVQCTTSTLASLLNLADLSRLERKAELLAAYVWRHDSADPPGAYRLSAFRNARGFLVALMREAAQVKRKCIGDIKLRFQVPRDTTYAASLPSDAVYLCGLELSGASWDTQLGALQDTVSVQPCSLPPVYVNAEVRSTNTSDTFPCKSSYLMDAGHVEVSEPSPLTASQLPVYHCPLYLDEERETGDWGLADVNIITRVPLHARLNPVLCSVRRVRLVSRL